MPPSISDTTSPSILVAGGSGIIGRAICQSFGQYGWHIGVHYHHNYEDATGTVRMVRERGGTATALQADCRDIIQVEQMVRTFLAESGRLDAFVYAVGVGARGVLVRTLPELWSDVIAVNLTGCFFMLKTIGPILHQQQEGTVVIVGSLSSLTGLSGQTAYAASKAGLIGLMKTTAREWGPHNIKVNVILPGWQASPLSGQAFPGPSQLQDHVLGRTTSPEEVAQAVYQLTQLKELSGQIWNLDSRIW